MNMIRGFGYVGSSSARQGPLSDDQLRQIAPSIFATEPHESRSQRFAYIPTIDVLNGLRAEGFEPFEARQGRSRIPGKAEFTKHMIRLRHGESPKRIGDAVFEAVLVNSHDGTSSYVLQSAIKKLICLNGMMTGDSHRMVKVRHTGDAIAQVVAGAYEVLGQADQVLEQVEQFSNLELTPQEQELFAKSIHQIRFEAQAHGPTHEDLLMVRRHQDRGMDLWRTMNVVQENTIRGGLQFRRPVGDSETRTQRVRTRPITSIDGDTKLNRAIWMLGEEMARLKAA